MQPEQAIKRDVRSMLTRRGIYWDNVAQGAFSKPGQPDIVACVNGRFIGIEVKTPRGTVRPIQRVRGQEIERSGGLYWVIRSTEELERRLNDEVHNAIRDPGICMVPSPADRRYIDRGVYRDRLIGHPGVRRHLRNGDLHKALAYGQEDKERTDGHPGSHTGP